MTDWTQRLLPASFNGIAFHVESADVEAGHRVTTTTIPNGGHILESFGPQARKFEIEAYFTGLNAPATAASLVAAAETRHAGVLVLPDSGAQAVRLTKARRSFEKDKLGFVAVSLEAVAEPSSLRAGLSASALENRVYALALAAVPTVAAFLTDGLQIIGRSSVVQEAAIEAAADSLGDLVALREAVRLSPAGLAAVAPAFTAAALALPGLATDPAAFGTAVAQAAIALGDATDPETLAETIVSFGQPAPAAPPAVTQGSAVTVAENAAIATGLTAVARAIALGEAQARRSYPDRATAVAARQITTAVFDDALGRLGRAGLDLAAQLATLSGVLAELVTVRAADLAPVITVQAPARLPSLWWAWRLYADPQRAADLASRAGVFHPGFMPERFEALAA